MINFIKQKWFLKTLCLICFNVYIWFYGLPLDLFQRDHSSSSSPKVSVNAKIIKQDVAAFFKKIPFVESLQIRANCEKKIISQDKTNIIRVSVNYKGLNDNIIFEVLNFLEKKYSSNILIKKIEIEQLQHINENLLAKIKTGSSVSLFQTKLIFLIPMKSDAS